VEFESSTGWNSVIKLANAVMRDASQPKLHNQRAHHGNKWGFLAVTGFSNGIDELFRIDNSQYATHHFSRDFNDLRPVSS